MTPSDPEPREAERVRLVRVLRQLADGLEALPPADTVAALTQLTGHVERLARRAEAVLPRRTRAPGGDTPRPLTGTAALQQAAQPLQAIVDKTTAVIYLKDLQGRYLLINERFEDLFHISRDVARGKTDADVFPYEMAAAFQANDRRVLAAQHSLEFDEIAPHDDGPHDYISIKFPLRDPAGAIYAVCGISTDITDRKRAEDALRASEARYRGLVESQQALIGRADPEGRTTFVNDFMCETFGLSREQLLATSYWPRIHEEDRAEMVARLQEVQQPPYRFAPFLCRCLTLRGWRWFEWEGQAIRDSQGQVVEIQSIGRDVTDRRVAEEALRESLEKLRLLTKRQAAIREEERKQLGFDLHDNICQDLVAVGILVASVRQRLGPALVAEQANLDRSVRYLNVLVERLRTVARDLRPLQLVDLGLEASLRELATGMSTEAAAIQATIVAPIPRLPEDVEIGVYRIAQEALTNARRHARARTIALMLSLMDGALRLEVRDDGRGFDAPHRATASGLLGMEERARALGARFTIWSAPGSGTTVLLECPLRPPAP